MKITVSRVNKDKVSKVEQTQTVSVTISDCNECLDEVLPHLFSFINHVAPIDCKAVNDDY